MPVRCFQTLPSSGFAKKISRFPPSRSVAITLNVPIWGWLETYEFPIFWGINMKKKSQLF